MASPRLRALRIAACVAAASLLSAAQCPFGSGANNKTSATVSADSADQVVYGMRAHLTQNGIEHGEIAAKVAYMYEDGTRVEMRDVTLTLVDSLGLKPVTMTARRGAMRIMAPTVSLAGDVQVVAQRGRKLKTDQLRVNYVRDEISGDGAYTLSDSLAGKPQTGNAVALTTQLTKIVAEVKAAAPKAATPKAATPKATTQKTATPPKPQAKPPAK